MLIIDSSLDFSSNNMVTSLLRKFEESDYQVATLETFYTRHSVITDVYYGESLQGKTPCNHSRKYLDTSFPEPHLLLKTSATTAVVLNAVLSNFGKSEVCFKCPYQLECLGNNDQVVNSSS